MKNNFNIYTLVITLFLSVSIACNSVKNDWEKVQQLNTSKAYSRFIEKHPESIYVDSANIAVNTLNKFIVIPFELDCEYELDMEYVALGSVGGGGGLWEPGRSDYYHPIAANGTFNSIKCGEIMIEIVNKKVTNGNLKTKDFGIFQIFLKGMSPGGPLLTYMATVENVEKMKVTFPNIKMLEKSAQISGHEFLVANAQREGVTTTVSGLQYEIIKVGTGPKPKAEDQVKCHYHCTSILGKVIDSTVDRGEPVVFQTDLAIAGCAEALQLMPVGSKWKLYIPSELGEEIKPNSALIFEIELLEILK